MNSNNNEFKSCFKISYVHFYDLVKKLLYQQSSSYTSHLKNPEVLMLTTVKLIYFIYNNSHIESTTDINHNSFSFFYIFHIVW